MLGGSGAWRYIRSCERDNPIAHLTHSYVQPVSGKLAVLPLSIGALTMSSDCCAGVLLQPHPLSAQSVCE